MGDGWWDDGWGGRHFRSRSLRKLRIIIFLGRRALSGNLLVQHFLIVLPRDLGVS